MKKNLVYIFIFFIHFSSFAQKKVSEDNQMWNQLFVNTKASKKITVSSDFGYRRKLDFEVSPYIWFARSSLRYQILKDLYIAPGFTYFSSNKLITNSTYQLSEFRPFIFIIQDWKYNIFILKNRYRIENRNIQKENLDKTGVINQYNSYFRVGYLWQVQIPLKGKGIEAKTPYIILSDELMINFGKSITNNYFDQNRMLFGFGYMFSKFLSASLSYQYTYQQKGVNWFENINTTRINISMNLDFSKKDNNQE